MSVEIYCMCDDCEIPSGEHLKYAHKCIDNEQELKEIIKAVIKNDIHYDDKDGSPYCDYCFYDYYEHSQQCLINKANKLLKEIWDNEKLHRYEERQC